MTYYEELGVPAGASREELRRAYKLLVRLLHPDHSGDDATRRLADLQMKRLNGMLSMLTDPVTRAAYDRSLAAGSTPAKRSEPLDRMRDPRWRRPATGIAAALIVVLICAVVPLGPPPHPRAAPASPKPAAPTAPPERKTAPRRPSRGHGRTIARERPSPPEAISRRPAEVPHAGQAPHESEASPLAALQEPERPVRRPDPATPHSIAGEWLFVASPAIRSTGYPPEYIELRVSEDHGAVRGRFRARYRVMDRAISPTVAFQFEGHSLPEGGVLPWRGAGGSQGEIKLRLLANGDLDVEWEASQLGEELGLISGKARLVRKLD